MTRESVPGVMAEEYTGLRRQELHSRLELSGARLEKRITPQPTFGALWLGRGKLSTTRVVRFTDDLLRSG